MSGPDIGRSGPVVAEILGRASVPGRRTVVLIDGRSGSGKTTLGRAVASRLAGAEYVGLDDVYPGWHGLAEASRVVTESILDLSVSGYRRWNWVTSEPSSWRDVDREAPLVIEGAGALTPSSARCATVSAWLELDAVTRRQRALARDGADYEPWWDVWAAQEEQHIRVNSPQTLADLVL